MFFPPRRVILSVVEIRVKRGSNDVFIVRDLGEKAQCSHRFMVAFQKKLPLPTKKPQKPKKPNPLQGAKNEKETRKRVKAAEKQQNGEQGS